MGAGAYGFFISLDLFLMFFFLGGRSDPKVFVDWHLGQRKENLQCKQAGFDAHGGFCVGIDWYC